ncbi:MAG: hypothetical protein IJ740_08510 [Ruminococcus sp.]|nr:hypothetical protein [Ruminococcus sp.]
MREILFRAKRDDNGEWVYGYYVHLPDAAGSVHIMHVPARNPDERNNAFYIVPTTLGQFTGLTDSSGKRIFEGDILATYDPDDGRGAVEYDSEETQFAVTFDNAYYGLGSNFHGTDLTVVGNIHDEPELFERE